MSLSLYQAVLATFKKMEWEYKEIRHREVIETAFEAYHGRCTVHVQLFPEIHALSAVSEFPLRFSTPAKKQLVAELLMRINQELTIGNFEMHWDHGIVLFRASNIFSSDGAEHAVIANLVHSAVAEMDRATAYLSFIAREEPENIEVVKLLERTDLLPQIEEPS